ncbi:MAG: radical SAM protein [Rickettsiales bacterium]|nr:MAG: radical SAM protein [Rickettsiales bacterium]
MSIKEITTKTAIHKHYTKYTSSHDGYGLNIYRGCEHKCKYCFAQYSHKYLDNSDFFDDIFVKTNIAEALDKDLSNKNWDNNIPIHISEVSDCYQPIEAQYQLMRQVFEVLIKHKQSAFILTKSPLILRDIDLICKLCKVAANVNINFSINSLNEKITAKVEPNVKSGIERMQALCELSKIENCNTRIFMIPVIPFLTDTGAELDDFYRTASEKGIKNIISEVLNLKGETKWNFYNFIKKEFPLTYNKITRLYDGGDGYVAEWYREKFSTYIDGLEKKYGISSEIRFKRNDLFD